MNSSGLVDATDVQILIAINELAEANGYPATYRDVAVSVRMTVSAVYRRVQSLREGGLVHASPTISRSLRLTPAGQSAMEHGRHSG